MSDGDGGGVASAKHEAQAGEEALPCDFFARTGGRNIPKVPSIQLIQTDQHKVFRSGMVRHHPSVYLPSVYT